jgi:hypothetical protein
MHHVVVKEQQVPKIQQRCSPCLWWAAIIGNATVVLALVETVFVEKFPERFVLQRNIGKIHIINSDELTRSHTEFGGSMFRLDVQQRSNDGNGKRRKIMPSDSTGA